MVFSVLWLCAVSFQVKKESFISWFKCRWSVTHSSLAFSIIFISYYCYMRVNRPQHHQKKCCLHLHCRTKMLLAEDSRRILNNPRSCITGRCSSSIQNEWWLSLTCLIDLCAYGFSLISLYYHRSRCAYILFPSFSRSFARTRVYLLATYTSSMANHF